MSILGGLAGSALLTHTSDQTFARLVPFLILFATLLFVTQGVLRRYASSALVQGGEGNAGIRGAIFWQFLVATYGGYFGAGIGILTLAMLAFIGMRNIHEMNALKTVLGSLINLMAALWFIVAGLIDWPRCAVMTIGAVAGYYAGSHFSQRISQARVRQIIAVIGFTISAVTMYKDVVRPGAAAW